jgi:hypothetical protein
MVYDNYNALAVGCCPGMRPSEAILSIALMPRWITLCFLQGRGLPDPGKRLRGDGNIVRSVCLESGAKILDEPDIRALIGEALQRAKVPIPGCQQRQFLIKSVSAKQRPRGRLISRELARNNRARGTGIAPQFQSLLAVR